MNSPLKAGGSALSSGGQILGTPSPQEQRLARQRAQRRTARQIRTGTYERGEAGRAYLRAVDRIPDGPGYVAGGVTWYLNVFGRVIEYPPDVTLDNLRGTIDLAELTQWWVERFGQYMNDKPQRFEVSTDDLLYDQVNWSDDIRIAVMRMGFEEFRKDVSRRTKEWLQLDAKTRNITPEPWGWYHSSGR